MNEGSQHVYTFNDFEFDADRLILHHRGALVKDAETKSLQVLAVLLANPNELVLHDEIIEAVWGDNPHGATATRVNHYASRLQKLFLKYEPETKFVENVRGRGYLFRGDVAVTGDKRSARDFFLGSAENNMDGEATRPSSESTNQNNAEATEERSKSQQPSRWRYPVYAVVAIAVISIAVFGVWKAFARVEDEEVRRVVRESQLFESLVLYKGPASFKEEQLDQFWTTELELNNNYDRRRIRDAVKKLIDEHRHYGDETKCELFDFQSVEVNRGGDMAVVKTLEKWFVSEYNDDGTLLRNRNIGPYFVSYVLRKVDGRWLIEKSTTARINRPTPHLSEISPESDVQAGKQFVVRIVGQDLEPEMIYLEVTGPGCPETTPCRVPNSALRENAALTANELDHVPLTLGSGEFRIAAHNGDSPAGQAVSLTVK